MAPQYYGLQYQIFCPRLCQYLDTVAGRWQACKTSAPYQTGLGLNLQQYTLSDP